MDAAAGRAALARLNEPSRRALALHAWAALTAIAAYTAVLSFYSIRRYTLFRAGAFDLGIFDQALWLISRGRFQAFSTVRGLPIMQDHWSPILFPLALLYRVWPDARCALIFQSFWLGLGAWPLFCWTRHAAGSPRVAIWVAVAYLVYPPLLYTNLWDFHPSAFAATPLLFAMAALQRDRDGRFLAWVGIAVLCKESVPLTVLVLGASLLARGQHVRTGLACVGMAVLGLLLVHASNPATPYVFLYRRFGRTLPGAALGFVAAPGKAFHQITGNGSGSFLLNLLYPCLYLPLFSPIVLAPTVPEILLDLMSSRSSMRSIRYQYTSTIAPFFWLAAAATASRIHRDSGWNVAPALVLACSLGIVVSGASLQFLQPGAPQLDPGEVRQAAALIPSTASLSTSPELLAHFSHRRRVYAFPNPFCQVAWGNTVRALRDQEDGVGLARARGLASKIRARPVQFVLFGIQGGSWPCSPALDYAVKDALWRSRDYHVVMRTNHLVLLTRTGRDSDDLRSGFHDRRT